MTYHYNATLEPLWAKQVNPHELFPKTASISRMPDDDRMWGPSVLQQLIKQLPYVSQYDISVDLSRIEPEAGFAYGHALIRSKKSVLAGSSGSQMVKIPIIIADRQLQPFYVFLHNKDTYPLSADRLAQVVSDPALFAGASRAPKTQKSLIEQLHPPYQQRQGFGRISGAGAASKTAGLDDQAAQNLEPKDLRTIAALKENEDTDAAMRGLSFKERANMAKLPVGIGTGVGAALGGARAYMHKGGKPLRSVLTGAGWGLGVGLAGQGASEYGRRKRDSQRRSGLFVDTYKEASLTDAAIELVAPKVTGATLHKFAKADQGRILRQRLKTAAHGDIPNFRKSNDPEEQCGTCRNFQKNASEGRGYCALFDTQTSEQTTCSEWAGDGLGNKEASMLRAFNRRR